MIDVNNSLEYNQVLKKIAQFAKTNAAKQEIASICPYDNLEQANLALQLVEEVKTCVNPLIEFNDCTDILKKARIKSTLNQADLFSILQVLVCCKKTKIELANKGQNLQVIVDNIVELESLYNAIFKAIDENGQVKDNASHVLQNIRRQLVGINKKLQDKLTSYTAQQSEYCEYLQDNIVTVRNGRFVIPVKSEYKTKVQGLLHDQSASGNTVFIEPLTIVSLNNELKQLVIDEHSEIDRIFRELTELVFISVADIFNNITQLVFLDVVFAKAEYAIINNCTMPCINMADYTQIYNARHPLIDANTVVPIDIIIDKKRLLLISGPNTGGKTVALKTIGLLSLMAASGIFLPCQDDSQIAIYKDYFVCLGDEQSLEQSYSTFSSHIVRIQEILKKASSQSLVLIDELGTGTDPDEGVALAIAIVEKLLKINCVSVVTSHFARLKEYASVTDNIQSASMHFDRATLSPTYKLIFGVAGASNALDICTRLKLDASIVKRAYNLMDSRVVEYNQLLIRTQDTLASANLKFEEAKQLNEQLSNQMQELLKDRQELKALQDKVNATAQREIAKAIDKYKASADEIIEQIKQNLMDSDEKALLLAKQNRTMIDKLLIDNSINGNTSIYEPLDAMPKKGDKIIVKSLGNVGIVKDIDIKGKVLVSIGAAIIKCDMDNLAKNLQIDNQTNRHLENKPTSNAIYAKNNNTNTKAQTSNEQINVIGQTVAEAIANIDPVVSSCIMNGIMQLTIVHGKGTGVLGKGIQKYLKTIKNLSIRYGGYYEGEKGVTIVNFNSVS